MNYLMMIYAAEARFHALSAADAHAVLLEYGQFTTDLMATERAFDCAALEPVRAATSVQIRGGKRLVKDGPYAETKEQLGGYYTFAASSQEEALNWAARIPDAQGGTIELRPLTTSPAPEEPGTARRSGKEFLVMIHNDESQWQKLSPAEVETIMARYQRFNAKLRAEGRLIAGGRLAPSHEATTLRFEGTKRIIQDGPFAETKEQLGGYYRLIADHLDDAIALASEIPGCETGTVEIRPVMDTNQY